MSSSLTELVQYLTSFSEETTKIAELTDQMTQCKGMLKYIEELKNSKEGGQAISKLTQK